MLPLGFPAGTQDAALSAVLPLLPKSGKQTMKHPFQVGDLLRSRLNRENLAIALRVYTMDGRPYLDVKYLRGNVVPCLPIQRFTLLSRAEQ